MAELTSLIEHSTMPEGTRLSVLREPRSQLQELRSANTHISILIALYWFW